MLRGESESDSGNGEDEGTGRYAPRQAFRMRGSSDGTWLTPHTANWDMTLGANAPHWKLALARGWNGWLLPPPPPIGSALDGFGVK